MYTWVFPLRVFLILSLFHSSSTMTTIQVLFSFIFVGVTVVMIMLYDQTPSVVSGPVKSHAAMATVRKVLLLLMFLVLLMIMSCVYNVIMIQKIHDYLFELTLMGFLAFLVLLIDKVHNYKKELSSQRKVNTRKQPEVETTLYETTTLRRRLRQVESQLEKELKEKTVATTRLRTLVSRHEKETKERTEKETKERTERILLDTRLKQVESELETKKKDVRAAEANSIALKKQCDGLLYEYNRLLEENEFVKNQLRVCDWRLSHSGSKKNL